MNYLNKMHTGGPIGKLRRSEDDNYVIDDAGNHYVIVVNLNENNEMEGYSLIQQDPSTGTDIDVIDMSTEDYNTSIAPLFSEAPPQEIEINQQDVLPPDTEVIDLDNALNRYNMNGPKFGYRSPAQWDNPSYDDTTPDKRNFLQKGWDMIKEDIAKKKEARQKYRDIWQDRADRRDETRDKIRDARRTGRALGKNERLGIRNPKLDTRLQEIELRNKMIGERDPFSVGNSEDRELLRRELAREMSEEDIAKMKGQYTRKGMRDVDNLERNIAIQQKESARQPFIESQSSNILADRLALKQRAFDRNQQNEIENFAARYNKKNEDFAKRMQNKLDRQYYKSIGVKPGQKASEADMQLQLDNMQPVQPVLINPSRNVNEYNLVPNPYKAEEFDKKQFGGRYGNTSYNINPDLNKFDQFSPANNQVKVDGLGLIGNEQLDRWESQRLEPDNWKFDIGEKQRTIANQLNNYSNNRNTRLPNFGPAPTNTYKKQSNWLNNTINTIGDWYDDERLEYTGNRVQNRGNMIPAMWNMTKYIGDNPEKEKLVAPAMAYTEKYVTPDILPLLRNKQQNINMIRQNARGTGDVMANIQQLHANTIKQEADVANKVQAANMGQRDKYEQAKQAYLDEYRSEVLRKQATDRANRGDWESLGSKAMTEYGNALRQKGMMLNQEEADRMREDMYLNQLTNDYKVVRDKDGNRYIETVINGKVVNLTPHQHQEYLASKRPTAEVLETNDVNAPVRGTATTPVGNNATTTVNKKHGGKTRVRNRLYY